MTSPALILMIQTELKDEICNEKYFSLAKKTAPNISPIKSYSDALSTVGLLLFLTEKGEGQISE